MPPIYLDCNSTCPLLAEVAAALAEANAALYANPASQHAEGRRARRALEDAREEIARLLGADLTGPQPDRLIFTSGGTEANNLALRGLLGATAGLPSSVGSGATGSTRLSSPKSASAASGVASDSIQRSAFSVQRFLIVSSIEHPSVTTTADSLARRGCRVEKLRVSRDGIVDLAHLDELLISNFKSQISNPSSALVSVLLANNETGVLQPIPEIVRRCAAASQNGNAVLVHTDAVQAVGKIPVSFRGLGVDAMTVAPHKFGGPRGIGALLVRHGVDVAPILHGATQQFGLRPGTESVALAIGFLAALRAWERDRDNRPRRLAALRDRFEQGLQEFSLSLRERAGVRGRPPSAETPLPLRPEVGRGVQAASTYSPLTYSPIQINGAAAPRLPNTSNVAFLGHDRQALFMALDLAGVCCSTGSACQSGSSEPSPTLLAMGLPPEIVSSSLRFSLGPTTTEADIDESLRRIAHALSPLPFREG